MGKTTQATPIYRRLNFLYGASAACLFLAFFTLGFGNMLVNTSRATPYKLVHVSLFTLLSALLLWVKHYSSKTEKPVPAKPVDKQTKRRLQHHASYVGKHTGTVAEPSTENLMEIHVQEQVGDTQPRIRRYDVRHPTDVVDSQC